jgi:NNP family nitrate/nitrite transporter-like MFS transporter
MRNRHDDGTTRGGAQDAGGGSRREFPLGAILLLVSVFFLTFLGRTVLSPLLLPIEADLGISHAQAGSFFLVISIGLMTTMLLSGFLSQRLSHHTTISLAVATVGLGALLFAGSRSLPAAWGALLVIGAGAGLYLPSGVATLTDVARPQQWGRAIAFHELGPILGLAAGPVLAELTLRVAGWRELMAGIGIVACLAAAAFARFGAGGRFHGAPPHFHVLRELMRSRRFWIIAFFFIMAIGLELGVYSMLPTYLVVDRGLDQSTVNTVVASSRLTSLLAVFAAGWLTDRFGVRHVIGGVAATAGAVTAALGFTDGGFLVAAVYLQPMLISAFFPAGLSALAGLGTAERRNVSVSVMIPLAYLFGAGLIPAVMGRLAEADAFGVGFIAVGVLMAAGVLLMPALRRS